MLGPHVHSTTGSLSSMTLLFSLNISHSVLISGVTPSQNIQQSSDKREVLGAQAAYQQARQKPFIHITTYVFKIEKDHI